MSENLPAPAEGGRWEMVADRLDDEFADLRRQIWESAATEFRKRDPSPKEDK